MHLSFSIKVAKVELGNRQLTAVCELPIVIRPSCFPCIAVAERLRPAVGKWVKKNGIHSQGDAHVRQVPCAWQ